MRKLTLTFALLAGLVAAPVAANAQGFLLGMVVGGMMFGGSNNQYGGAGANILYTASDETIKAVDPLSVRQVASRTCFNENYAREWRAEHKTLGELFVELTKGRGQKERTILQIARVFQPSDQHCAAIWFAYVEK